MTKLRASLALSAADTYVGLVLQLASTFILSRLLTPAEIGVFAVAAVFAALASTFRDFGVAEYLIQEQDLTTEKVRAAFTVNIAASWLMGGLMLAGAGAVGDFYRTPGITDVMQVQAFNFLLIPFGAVTMAWFRREMNFKPVFLAGLAANITAFGVSVACALQGFGYMSLAWSSLAGVAVNVVMALLFRPSNLPRWPGVQGIGAVLHFSKFASGVYIFGQLGKGAPEMIIGRARDMVSVAVFSRANGLVQIFRQLVLAAVMPVCLPYFSKAVREEGSVVRGYVASVSYFSAIGWPFLGFMALAAFPAIRIVYGDQWTQAVPLARILCLAGALELVHCLANEALMSQGQVRLSIRLQLMLQAAFVIGLLAAVPFGLFGACLGVLAASLLGLLLAQWHLHVGTGLSLADTWQGCRGSLLVSALTLAPMLASLAWVRADEHNFVRYIAVGGTVTALMWLTSLRLSHHPLWAELCRLATAIAGRLHTPPPA